MHAMWKPQKFKLIYLIATLYVLTLTLPSASAVYWAFGDLLLTHSNALSLLPKNGYRDTAIILMLIHQVNWLPLLSSVPTKFFITSPAWLRLIPDRNRFLIWVGSGSSLTCSCPSFDALFSYLLAVHNIWICMHPAILRVGEIHKGSRHEECVKESSG